MKTVDALYRKYGDKFAPLDQVAADYYGITNKHQVRMALRKNGFPGLIPFRARPSRKAPLLVSIDNLAEALDRRARG